MRSIEPASAAAVDTADPVEASAARLLSVGTLVSITLLTIGALLLLVAGTSPLAGGPALDPTRLIADLQGAQPAAFLWIGLVAVIGTPSARVVASLVGYVRQGERTMAIVAILILVVIAASVVAVDISSA